MWQLEYKQRFPLIWPGELDINFKWPIFKFDLEVIKTNILSNSNDDYLKNETTGVLTRFSLIRFGDLVFKSK